MIGLLCGEETNYNYNYILAVSIEYRNATDGQNCYINIARQYADTW